MSNDTIFTKIIKREIPAEIIYEDDEFISFLDIKTTNEGHSLVVPKNVYENYFDMPDEMVEKFAVLIKKIAPRIKEAVSADGVNLIMNNGKEAGQIIFHAHMHIIPRFSGDGFSHWPGKDMTPEELKKTAEKIKKVLSN